MTLPSFLIIGAAKAGTTALWRVLGQHPEVFVSPMKEPRFFAFEGGLPSFGGPARNDYTDLPTITTLADYQALFDGAGDAKAIGEASTVYLYYPGGRPAENIRRYVPGAKLIAILRHPAERAYSNYLHALIRGWEPRTDFAAALNDEPRRIHENWSYFLRYKQNGHYHAQLQCYADRFDRSQIRVFLYEDWLNHREEVLRDMLRFLGVDDTWEPARYLHSNVTRVPRSFGLHHLIHESAAMRELKRIAPVLHRVLVRGADLLNLYRPALPPDMRCRLTAEYRDDILKTQDLIGRDLSQWLES